MWKKLILEDKYIEKIRREDSTLLITSNDKVVVDDNTFGVISLLKHYDVLANSSSIVVYDKLIGKGAAMLIASFDVKKIFAKTITEKALEILSTYCEVEYDRLVENILNRDRSDLCPIEKIAKDIENVETLRNELKKFYIERGFLDG